MANGQLDLVVRRIRKLAGSADADRSSDKSLLESFIARRDDSAFAQLLERHGPMVLSLCRRLLGNRHDAEDAFQATFLVLIRKARSIRKKDSLASWLHGVAYRVAREARAKGVRRQAHERQVSEMSPSDPASDALWRDLRLVLDEELQRLPDKYRVPLILCYLEGKTTDEAARLLGWPRGTVGGRLARARQLLRRRLARRGMALSAGSLATALASTTASASIPPALAEATLKAAAVVAAGQAMTAAAVSQPVAALTEGAQSHAAGKAEGDGGRAAGRRRPRHGSIDASGAGCKRHRYAEGRNEPAPQEWRARIGGPSVADCRRTRPGRIAWPAQAGRQGTKDPHRPCPRSGWQGRGRKSSRGDWLVSAIIPEREWDDRADVLDLVKAAADGQYRLKIPESAWDRFREINLLAAAPGFGLGWQQLDAQPKPAEVVIPLRQEQVIRGRFVDLQGQPAARVTLNVIFIGKIIGGETKGLHYDAPKTLPLWPGSISTDDQGRFVLSGIGKDLEVTLQMSDERFARQLFLLKSNETGAGKEITRALEPAQLIEGAVTYADTGHPVPRRPSDRLRQCRETRGSDRHGRPGR